jgi:hypothetical protein
MIEVPNWDGNTAHPFPSVTLRIDFRGNDIGTFVFHCHILGHEDLGMMNIIQVVPATSSAASIPKKIMASAKTPSSKKGTGAAKSTAAPAATAAGMQMKMK